MSEYELNRRLNEIEQGYQDRADQNANAIHRWARQTVAILAVLALITAGSGVINVYLLRENSKRSDDIQRERVEATLTNCKLQNARYDVAVQRLNAGIAAIKDPQQRARANHSKAFSVSLIDALAPKRDCVKLANQIVPSESRHG